MIWLNNRTCGPLFPKVKEIFSAYADPFSSLGSHQAALSRAEDAIRTFVGISLEDYVFKFLGNGGNIALTLFPAVLMHSLRNQGKNCFLLASTAEKQFIDTLSQMQIYGSHYDWVISDKNGVITESSLISSISPRSLLLSFSLANGLTGLIQPVEDIFSICQERDIITHVEVSHAIGKIPLSELNGKADLISFCGTSLNGIPGTGGIFIKKKLFQHIKTFFPDHNENAPFHPVSCNLALGKNIECLSDNYRFTRLEINRLRNLFEEEIKEVCSNACVLFKELPRLPDVTVIYFQDIAAESLAFFLHLKKIYPCLGGNIFQPLPQILQASGITPLQSFSCLSFGFTPFITEEEILTTIDQLKRGMKQLEKHIITEPNALF